MTRPDHDGKQAGGECPFGCGRQHSEARLGVEMCREWLAEKLRSLQMMKPNANELLEWLKEWRPTNPLALEMIEKHLNAARAEGFAAGIEAAAKLVDQYCYDNLRDWRLAKQIRALPPPTQERENGDE